MILFLFSFMCFVQEFENEGFETFYQSFLTIFSGFVGDPEPAQGPLDIVFGVIMIVALLNVVIAIVSSSWENAVETSLILLVTHRLQLLRRANDAASIVPTWVQGEWHIDRKFDEPIDARVDMITQEYEFWISSSCCHPARFLCQFMCWLCQIIRPLITAMFWLCGLLTFGLMWPACVRKSLFAIKPEKASVSFRIGQAEEQATNMSKKTNLIFGELKDMKSKLAAPESETTRISVRARTSVRASARAPRASNANSAHALVDFQGKLDSMQNQLRRMASQQQSGSPTDSVSSSELRDRIANLELKTVQMDNDLQTVHTKIDLILQHMMNASSANEPSRRRMPDVSLSLRPSARDDDMNNSF